MARSFESQPIGIRRAGPPTTSIIARSRLTGTARMSRGCGTVTGVRPLWGTRRNGWLRAGPAEAGYQTLSACRGHRKPPLSHGTHRPGQLAGDGV